MNHVQGVDGLGLVPAANGLEPASLIRLFSNRPKYLVTDMINVEKPSVPESVPIDTDNSSLGDLDIFPHEILDMIAVHMDPQSLARLTCVSRKGKAIREGCKLLDYFMKYAPKTAAALVKARITTLPSVLTLCEALHNGRCVSCDEFGPYLFLPTCERVCWPCTQKNPAFWVIPAYVAHGHFGFQREELKHLPTMYSVAGESHREPDHLLRLKLVSARQAKETSIRLNGLEAAQEIWQKVLSDPNLRENNVAYIRQLHGVQLGPPYNKKLFLTHRDRMMTKGPYHNKAATPFPWVRPDGGVEEGLWCRGCAWLTESWPRNLLPRDFVSSVVREEDPAQYWADRHKQAWTMDEFLEHMGLCVGAAFVMATFGSDEWHAWELAGDSDSE